jgi:hypothetical protein
MVGDKVKPGKQIVKKDADDLLLGMKAICSYVHRSEPTVLSLVRSSGFPAKKIGGIWESWKSRIDQWRVGFWDDDPA